MTPNISLSLTKNFLLLSIQLLWFSYIHVNKEEFSYFAIHILYALSDKMSNDHNVSRWVNWEVSKLLFFPCVRVWLLRFPFTQLEMFRRDALKALLKIKFHDKCFSGIYIVWLRDEIKAGTLLIFNFYLCLPL